MAMKTIVTVSVRSLDLGGPSWSAELGEFHAVWEKGVSIGSDPACDVVLRSPEVPPVAARVIGASNHKLLYRLPPGAALPLPPVTHPVAPYDERVDYREFQVGRYIIRFDELVREDQSPDS